MSSIKYTPEEVIEFCRNQKYKIVIQARKDRKNENFRASVGITYSEEQEIIRNLRVENLFQGPILDRDRANNYLYEFHKEVYGKWCYIKLTIVEEIVVVNVISFHESEGVEYV